VTAQQPPTGDQSATRRVPTAQEPAPRKAPFIQVDATRNLQDGGRTTPRMRVDVLQIVGWILGLYFLVSGLVALARAGFEDMALFDPTVEVGGFPLTPLLALLYLIIGVGLLAASTGIVKERGLRIAGVLLGVVGAVWLIEPDPFTEYLGVVRDSGAMMLTLAVLLVAASFVPPLSVARPGVPERS
jgi:hypothetical protein